MGRGTGGHWAPGGGTPGTLGGGRDTTKHPQPRPCPGRAMNGSGIVFQGGISAARPRRGREEGGLPALGKLRHGNGGAQPHGKRLDPFGHLPPGGTGLRGCFSRLPRLFALDNPPQGGAGHPQPAELPRRIRPCRAKTPPKKNREENSQGGGGRQRCRFDPRCCTWLCPSPRRQA